MKTDIPLFIPGRPYAGLHELAFELKPEDKVLDIGGGQTSFPRANVVLEKFAEDNSQRLGRPLQVRPGQELVIADAENMPFTDKEFKLAFSSHVFEHIDNLPRAIDEINRVAEYVFMACPKGDFDYYIAKRTWGHVNFVYWLGGKLYIKKRLPHEYSDYFSGLQHQRWHDDSLYNEHFERKERWVWENRLFVKTPLLYEVVK